jgi:hypothetical protein
MKPRSVGSVGSVDSVGSVEHRAPPHGVTPPIPGSRGSGRSAGFSQIGSAAAPATSPGGTFRSALPQRAQCSQTLNTSSVTRCRSSWRRDTGRD